MRFPAFLGVALLLASPLHATTFVLEAEQLEVPGGWEQSTVARSEAVRGFILAGPHARQAPAVGGVAIPHAGKWRLWVRSKDFAKDRPGTRTFSVRVGAQRSATVFGRHGREEPVHGQRCSPAGGAARASW